MSMLNKMLSFVGFDTEEEMEQEYYDAPNQEKEAVRAGSSKGKVVNIHAATQLKLVIMNPESFEEARDIADHLKSKKPVVINLEGVEREIARRIVDFLSGAVFALDGSIQKVSNGIFLIAPYNVGIMGDFKDDLKTRGIFSWKGELA